MLRSAGLGDLARGEISHVLEHSNRDQIVVDVAAAVASIHVNRVQHCHEVLLAKSVDVVTDNEFEAAESTRNDLITLVL